MCRMPACLYTKGQKDVCTGLCCRFFQNGPWLSLIWKYEAKWRPCTQATPILSLCFWAYPLSELRTERTNMTHLCSHCYLGGGPLPRPCPGPAVAPGPLGPRALGLGDAKATSLCRSTPLLVDPGFVFVGFVSDSRVFSDRQQRIRN